MFYLFLMVVAAIGVGVYLTFIFQNVPGVKEERLGALEPLPEDLGSWKTDESSEAAQAAAQEDLIREVRLFYEEARERLVEQVRYRRASDSEIVRVEPDRRVKRRRVKKPG